MTKSSGKLKILNFGDVHLGHGRTPTEHILSNLDKYISVLSVLDDVDLVTIAGDFFDRCLSYSDHQVGMIERWITRFLIQCASKNVVLRVLEGTPSHDWKQSSFFEEQARNANIPVDVKHVVELSIEHIDSLDIDVLYVPDKWRPTTVETWSEVQGLLAQHKLTQVDFALMHGAFEYQLPAIVTEPSHDSAKYLAIVKHLIFIGHVHRSFVKGRIVPSGSFDRLVQGEEEAKGFHTAVIDLSKTTYELTFHENKKAKVYKAIDIAQYDEVTLWDFLDQLVKHYPIRSAFSLRVGRNNVLTTVLRHVRSRYPDYEWDMVVEKTKKEKSEEMERAMQSTMVELPELTSKVLTESIIRTMKQKQVKEHVIQLAMPILEDMINGNRT